MQVKKKTGESDQQARARGRAVLERVMQSRETADDDAKGEYEHRLDHLLRGATLKRLAADESFTVDEAEGWADATARKISDAIDRQANDPGEPCQELAWAGDTTKAEPLDRGHVIVRQATGEGRIETGKRAAAVWSVFDSVVGRRDLQRQALELATAKELESNESFTGEAVAAFVAKRREEYERVQKQLATPPPTVEDLIDDPDDDQGAGTTESTSDPDDEGPAGAEAVEPCSELAGIGRPVVAE